MIIIDPSAASKERLVAIDRSVALLTACKWLPRLISVLCVTSQLHASVGLSQAGASHLDSPLHDLESRFSKSVWGDKAMNTNIMGCKPFMGVKEAPSDSSNRCLCL